MRTMTTVALCLIAALAAPSAGAQESVTATKADAAKVLKATNVAAGAGVTRLALTSCNVLFGVETSASSSTQAGFGEPTAGRVDTNVSVTYALQGMDEAALQVLTEQVCADAAARYAAMGYEIVPQADVNAHPEFVRLQSMGKPVPYAYSRAGSKYQVLAPAGQTVFDPAYLNSKDSVMSVLSTIGGATSGNTYQAAEGALLQSLDASGLHVNVMVDFAKAKGTKASGFLGKMAGNDTAKVEAEMQLSVSGFVLVNPLDKVQCYAGNVCMVGADAKATPRFTTSAPILAGSNAVVSIADIQSKGSKAGELGANVFAGAMALGGYSTSMSKVEKNGVTVDPAIYSQNVAEMAGQFIGMAAVLGKP
jgi:hypothetical protein